MKVNIDLIHKVFDASTLYNLPEISYMVAQYQKAVHFERIEQAQMIELAIEKYVCYTKDHAVQE